MPALTTDPDGNSSSSMYYAFFEAREGGGQPLEGIPIVLWLQGGPGCASTFGGFFELGPVNVDPDLKLEVNPGSWNWRYGLLLLDQPVGSGYSIAASNDSIPRDEMEMAYHLYSALQQFFTAHPTYQSRPLFITGESYGGKYVPSAAHYILQCYADAPADPNAAAPGAGPATKRLRRRQGVTLQQRRDMPLHLPAQCSSRPLFHLAGIAIGNGLTDPRQQTLALASSAFDMGLLSTSARRELTIRVAHVIRLIDSKQWVEAQASREALFDYIAEVSGLPAVYDVRRTEDYDVTQSVDRYLNQAEVKAGMRAHPDVNYTSCSSVVADRMAGDVMRSVKHLFPDLLDNLPVLLYQGQFDLKDGVASSSAWIDTIPWRHIQSFRDANSTLWYPEDPDAAGSVGGDPRSDATAGGGNDGSNGGTSRGLLDDGDGGRSSARRQLRAAATAGDNDMAGQSERLAGRDLLTGASRLLSASRQRGRSTVAWSHDGRLALAKGTALRSGDVASQLKDSRAAVVLGQQSEAGDAMAAAATTASGLQQQQQQPKQARQQQQQPQVAAAGWTRSYRTLTQTVVYRAGHMVPHDQPVAARQMLESWITRVLADQGGSSG